jgi:threonine dehydrogenase-like Zn-dependent dehydrogenase
MTTAVSGATGRVGLQIVRGILTGTVNPDRVIDREVTLDQTPEGHQDMDSRRALKVLIRG